MKNGSGVRMAEQALRLQNFNKKVTEHLQKIINSEIFMV